jgi:hypothetical protein
MNEDGVPPRFLAASERDERRQLPIKGRNGESDDGGGMVVVVFRLNKNYNQLSLRLCSTPFFRLRILSFPSDVLRVRLVTVFCALTVIHLFLGAVRVRALPCRAVIGRSTCAAPAFT